MANYGILARISVVQGATPLEITGVKDISPNSSANEISVESRGFSYVRVLPGQKSYQLDLSLESDSNGVAIFNTAHQNGTSVKVRVEYTNGYADEGDFVCTRCDMNSPVNGEETCEISLRPSALPGDSVPSRTAPNGSNS